jgi:hypothetical protein
MDKVLPVELVRALDGGKWVADGDGWVRGDMFLTFEQSPSVFGSWRWTVEMRDRAEVRTSYGVTKSLCEFVRFGA